MENIKVINADCIQTISSFEDNSIDCIITDPPYFIDKLDNNWNSSSVTDHVPNSHIKHLPKGMKFDKIQTKTLYDFYYRLSCLLIQKLKPGGYFLSFCSPRLYHALAMAVDLAGFEIRDMINWTYTQTMPKGMSVNHLIGKLKITDDDKEKLKKEYADFKTPMLKSCFEPICVAMKPIETTFLNNELVFKTGLLNFGAKVGINGDKIPANLITTEEFNEVYDKNFLVPKPTKKEKINNHHPTVKPVQLMEQLIRIFSKENSIVLDPFSGSGTTLVACKNLNRRCIGIELNKEYYDIIINRLKD